LGRKEAPMKSRRLPALLPVILLFLLLSGCTAPSATVSDSTEQSSDISNKYSVSIFDAYDGSAATTDIFAMDTYMTITCYGEDAKEAVIAAAEEIQRLDSLLSVGIEDSEIAVINSKGSGAISEDTGLMIDKALALHASTGGAFDITIYPLMVEWGFTSQDFHVPDEATLKALLPLVDSDAIRCHEDSIVLGSGQGIDLGGIAKGYTSGRLMDLFDSFQLSSALVNLGGNVHCYGSKPDGSSWHCGIQNPDAPDNTASLLGVVSVTDEAVITSGAYQRYFTDEASGKTYHHILNPETGYPADSDLISVSIISQDGMLADGLSTACYIMGLDTASQYWQNSEDNFEMILMTNDRQVYITEGLSDRFSSDYPVNLIRKAQ